MDIGVIRSDARSAPFFEAAARDELLIKRCGRCERWLGPEATGCAGCGDCAPRWEAACGRGTLVSFAGLPGDSRGPGDGVAGDGAAVLALVELDEGPWLHTRLAPVAVLPVAVLPVAVLPVVGMPVVARFEHPAEGESYPVFWPQDGS
jgi:uncharacterized protein